MIDGRRVLAVVPARGGSKGIPLKNLRKIGGISLVARAGRIAGEIAEIDRAVVSTDHEDIAREAEHAGLEAPFRRPEDLSGDRIGDLEVLRQALEATEADDGQVYDIVLMLQPTSPMRRAEHVAGCLRMLVDGRWDSVWTVSETDSKAHPLKQLTVRDGVMEYYNPAGARIIARQQLEPVYHRNGVAYAITRECLCDQNTIKGRRAGAYAIDEPLANIDTEFDLQVAELMIGRA